MKGSLFVASLPLLYKPRFADTLKMGDTFCLNRVGREPMEVVADPVHTVNLVGEGKHIHVQVRLLHTTTEGVMVLTLTKTVYIHNPED